jgi:hypothetical protein
MVIFFFAAIGSVIFGLLKNILPENTQPPVQWMPGFSRGLCGRGVVLTTQPLSNAVTNGLGL